MRSAFWYLVAAIGEIAGCFAFWAWLRLGRSPWWILPGLASLIVFALVLTRIETEHAGRAREPRTPVAARSAIHKPLGLHLRSGIARSPVTLLVLGPATQSGLTRYLQWNQARIAVTSERAEHWLNGVRTAEYPVDAPFASPIMLQHHASEVRFRKLRIAASRNGL